MLLSFDKSSNYLDSNPFVKEEVRFNLMHRIRDSERPIMMKSKNDKIIIAQSLQHLPAWVWTDVNLEKQEYGELADDFYNLFSTSTTLKFIAKPGIDEFLANDYSKRKNITWKTTMRMEAYCCPEVIYSKNVSGFIRKASLDNLDVISEFFVGYLNDCFGITTTIEKQIETARAYILSGNFYIWEIDNKIVAMANIAHRSARHVRINEVYTSPLQRKKGYAGALISELCKIIFRENKTPMLYTDLLNPASNKAYKNVGFIECGKVNQISFEF